MKILIITNHSYMLYQFRKELIETLLKKHEVVLSMPFAGHEEDFQAMGCKCINTKIDRRGINPLKDLHLIKFYNKLLKEEKPDKVITYSIKPNIYAGLLCAWKKIPYYANVQGLGTAFQKPGLAQFVTLLYKAAFIKVQKVFFENKGNAGEFLKRRIVKKKKIKVLNGAGVNLEHYSYTEPLVQAIDIVKCIPSEIPEDGFYVSNLMTDFSNPVEVVDPTNLKIVTNKDGICLFISRAPIPFPKGEMNYVYQKFVGVGAFTEKALEYYHNTPRGPIEKIEENDSFRFIENRKDCYYINAHCKSLSVDTPKDRVAVERYMIENNLTE